MEYPSKRLDKGKTLIAPTWSWASLEGTVGIDLLPDSANVKLRIEEKLAHIVRVPTQTAKTPISEIDGLEGTLTLSGSMCEVTAIQSDGADSYIKVKNSRWNAARVFQDISDEDIWAESKLFCLSILQLERTVRGRKTKEIQGLVLRVQDGGSGSPRTYRRVGFFTTREMNLGLRYRKMFTEGEAETVEIV